MPYDDTQYADKQSKYSFPFRSKVQTGNDRDRGKKDRDLKSKDLREKDSEPPAVKQRSHLSSRTVKLGGGRSGTLAGEVCACAKCSGHSVLQPFDIDVRVN